MKPPNYIARRNSLLSLIMGAILLFPLLSFSQERQDRLIDEGRSFLESNEWQKLETLCDELLSRYPNSLKAEVASHKFLAELPANFDKYPPALGDLARADSLIHAPKSREQSARIHFHLGYVNYYLRDIPKAEVHFSKAKALFEELENPLFLYNSLNGLALLAIYDEKQSQSISWLKAAYKVALENQLQDGQAEALNQLSTIYFSLGKWDSSKRYFEQLLKLKRGIGNEEELVSDLTQLGQMLSSQGEFAEGQKYHLEALELATQLEDTLLMASILSDICLSYFNQENWSKTLEYGQKALSLLIPLGFHQLEASNYKYLGLAYQQRGQKKKALKALREASRLYFEKLDQATEALKLQVSIAEILEEEANYDEALQLLKAALEHKRKYSVRPDMLELQLSIAKIYLKRNQAMQALKYLSEAEELSQQLSSPRNLQRTYKMLARAHYLNGNFMKAYQLEYRQSQLRDSIFNQERARILQEMESRYQAEQKDRRNAELAVEVANKQLELEKNKSIILAKTQQNYVLIGSVILLLLLLGFLFYYNHNRQNLLQQRMITMEKEAETLRLRAVLQGEEQERQRVARELHDGLGALLASVKVLFQTLEVEFPKALNSQHYRKAEKLLDHACKEVRSISHNMLSSTLKEYGLEQAVHSLVQLTANHHQLRIDHHTHGLSDEIPEDVQISVYRITQELLRNVVKHAEAKEIFLQISVEDGLLLLAVEDDGKGFDRADVQYGGIGLKNIRARVEYLDGKIDMDSGPGKGTTVNIEIPLSQHISSKNKKT